NGILKNPVYLGTAAYGRRDGQKRPQDASTWLYSAAPAIVSRETWDAAHEALARRRVSNRRKPRSPETLAAFPLRGMLVCGHCQGALQCDTVNGHRNRYYLCRRGKPYWARVRHRELCPMPGLPAGALDDLAWRDVVETLSDPERFQAGLVAARAEHDQADGRRQSRLGTIDVEVARLRAR